jgi:resolvase-like protein
MNGNKSRGEDRDNRSAPTRPVAATFGLGSTAKIRDVHVNRLALVYVRQSTPQQVLENRESRERQYALAEFAQRLGWSAERVVVVDEDQGQSGKTAPERSGFQRLMTEVSLNHVGLVLGLELSRLVVRQSRSDKFKHGIQTLELDASVRRGELPVNFHLLRVAGMLPGGDFRPHCLDVGDAPVQALSLQYSQFELSHVQPTAVFRRVMNLQFVDQAPCLVWRKSLVQRGRFVRVEIVLHYHNLVRLGMHFVDQVADGVGIILGRTSFRYQHGTATGQRFKQHKEIARTVAFVFVIDLLRLTRAGCYRLPNVLDQLLGSFVKADHRPLGIIGPLVDIQSFLHLADECGIGCWRNYPLFM